MSCNGIKVLIAAPLKQEPKIFREYQDALDRRGLFSDPKH